MSKTREQINTDRVAVAAALNAGKTYSQIQKELNVSAPFISKTKQIMEDPNRDLKEDRRENNQRPDEYDPAMEKLVMQARAETDFGPRLLWAMMKRNPEKYGIAKPELIPSPATIGRWIQNAGLANHAIGPGDKRAYPIDTVDIPGYLTIDQHGPIHVGADRLWLITINDRFTRLGMAVPFHRSGSSDQYIHAIMKANKHLLDGKAANTLFADNGVGVCPMDGWTTQAVRYALKNGTRMVFIPPAQPWKNGRLENWHFRMDKEFFDRVDTKVYTEVVQEFLYWLNFYNMERPHSALKYKAPADLYPYEPLEWEDVMSVGRYKELEPQRGIVDAIRICDHNGDLEFWGGCNKMRVSNVFAGAYLRTRFYLEPEDDFQLGEVIWQGGRAQEPVTIATFSHNMDRGHAKTQFVYDIRLVDFTNSTITPPPTNASEPSMDTTSSSLRSSKPALSSESEKRNRQPLKARVSPGFHHLVQTLASEGYNEAELLANLPEYVQEAIEKRFKTGLSIETETGV